ncbi:hypothetical protein HanRHA438_Chr12g0562201 [Helianthus annuus]|uniref:Uncharacterized protein n=1 Tax=Helianthus annuus TaxID=4232 RepID=A0A9K3MWY4_HELAN|nr:hypothetical protein HanXRQr2_Chr12g0550911 [Helianthus annuus]KAJ0494186.1 hypothetical protein HanIR_Chr12g0594531 [Helianthus annuus]KAJ0863476.1 hypothetical protein HanPSC8_Chr12g0530431 [Helianthus annuus]KAJ0867354.1 hypothetical protein HanRHA438_Chr12g0562201 [Helianthus annuus]
MERLTRSFSTTSVDINKAWRSKVYDDGSPDLRKDMKTARFGDQSHHGRFSKIKKLFNLDRALEQQQEASSSKKKTKLKSKGSGSRDEFESRLIFEIYKNMSASHELTSMYN